MKNPQIIILTRQKKFKNEYDSKEIKSNKIKIDNILKNNQLKKINNAKK